ncbi:ROK family protein [Candidatus Acidulodesulfobacterium sp. H_13]|uniref:ROK family protein n=1 Tax=Candidatus Acidulodesulfobacterium sp. H_13 TaxID=3395470 RepID=UPI003AF4BACD
MNKYDKHIIGMDIGGTNLRFGVMSEDGVIKNSRSFPLNKYDEDNMSRQVDFITQQAKRFLEDVKIYGAEAAGVGIAGQIDHKTGNILFSPNLNWRNVPLKKILEKETGLRVNVANDLTAITYGEWKFGAGRGENDLVCIFVGTGIGSGIVINGSLYVGCSNVAGEIGHITVVSGGRKCTCGNSGCLEAYAGGWGIAEIIKERALQDSVGFKDIIRIAGGIDNISAETLADAYRERDGNAVKLVEEIGRYLSDGVITSVNFINPCAIVMGGGVIDGIPDLLDIVNEEVHRRALKASVSNIKILKAGLGKDSGIIGAAGLAAMYFKTHI